MVVTVDDFANGPTDMSGCLLPDSLEPIVQTKPGEVGTFPLASEKRQKEASSFKIFTETRHWFAGELKPLQ
jgi:hypothetical protein